MQIKQYILQPTSKNILFLPNMFDLKRKSRFTQIRFYFSSLAAATSTELILFLIYRNCAGAQAVQLSCSNKIWRSA